MEETGFSCYLSLLSGFDFVRELIFNHLINRLVDLLFAFYNIVSAKSIFAKQPSKYK